MASLSLSPVSVAIFGKLNVAAVTDLATGGVHDDVPQAPTFPFVWYEVSEREGRGFGTGGFPEVEIRVHVFSQYEGMSEAQSILLQAIAALKDASLTVAGYTQAGLVFYDETVMLPDEQLHGIKIHEAVAMFRVYVEEV